MTRPPERPRSQPGERFPASLADGRRSRARSDAEKLFAREAPASQPPLAQPPLVEPPTAKQSPPARVRTSLSRLPSGQSEEEAAAQRRGFERTLWEAHRGLVLRLDDPDLNGTHRIMIEALARARGFQG